ncbi:MAG: hypothetical protein WC846_04805 [Candidatus Gracilibacteria bacterium]|jgi:hypothetical protein
MSDTHAKKSLSEKELTEVAEGGLNVSAEVGGKDEFVSLDAEFVDGRVSEVAGETASENVSEQGGKSSSAAQTQDGDSAPQLSERELLREKLLKTAPAEREMRKEVKRVLLNKKAMLEKEVAKYKGTKDYCLLSLAIIHLRAVVRQMQIVARASYDLLKEIWLKVVHRFA